MQACNFYKKGPCFPPAKTYMETHARMEPGTRTGGPLKPRYVGFCSAFPVLFLIPALALPWDGLPFPGQAFHRAEGLFVLPGCPSALFVVPSLGCALLFQRARSAEEEAEDVNSHAGTQRQRKEDLFILSRQ